MLDGQGHLLTAAHAVDGGTSIRVACQDESTRSATIVGKDDASDVAVLHVDPADLKLHPISLGSSRALAPASDLEVLFAVEQQLQTAPHHLVIVGEHEPHRRRRPSVCVGDSSLLHDRRRRAPYRRGRRHDGETRTL